jgi:glycosyltransferase involved in cell wall biosynthesis
MIPLSETTLPRVTIMIPTYRQESVVLQAIDSALAQDYPNLEVIVADDASPDKTAEVVATRHDPRLIYYRNPKNLGRVGNYRNFLFNLASGDWVVNLDGDDYFTDPSFLRVAIELAKSDSEIAIVAARVFVNENNKMNPRINPGTTIVPGSKVILNYHNSIFHFSHMATLYRRDLAIQHDFYHMNVISSDWESLLRLSAFYKVAYLDKIIGCWVKHADNASNTTDWKALAENLRIWPSIYYTALQSGIPYGRLAYARHKNLSTVVYRDISKLIREKKLSAVFYYLDSVKSLSILITARTILSPKLWVKFFISLCSKRILL